MSTLITRRRTTMRTCTTTTINMRTGLMTRLLPIPHRTVTGTNMRRSCTRMCIIRTSTIGTATKSRSSRLGDDHRIIPL